MRGNPRWLRRLRALLRGPVKHQVQGGGLSMEKRFTSTVVLSKARSYFEGICQGFY